MEYIFLEGQAMFKHAYMNQFHILFVLLAATSIYAAEEGKVFLRTEPNGADVFLVVKGEDGKTEQKPLGKTASLFKLPEGNHTVIFKLTNFTDATAEFEVKGTEILKPDTVK